ncbi:MAG: hypothetical protein R3C58_01855 [Parvularculaceae bacterium]
MDRQEAENGRHRLFVEIDADARQREVRMPKLSPPLVTLRKYTFIEFGPVDW